MSVNTAHKVTLTEGQIGVILCSLEDYISKGDISKIDLVEFDAIFQELEGVVDKYYAKIERAKSKQPTAEWED